MFERYQTVRLHLLGYDDAAIAVSVGRKESTVETYLRQYRKQGLDGLQMKFSPGPPEQLETTYPSGKIVMTLDNARIHHAKLLSSFLADNKSRLELIFLPPYSPELNLVEGLWKWLKADVINNVFYHTTAEIRTNVQAFMDRIMKEPLKIIDRLYIRM